MALNQTSYGHYPWRPLLLRSAASLPEVIADCLGQRSTGCPSTRTPIKSPILLRSPHFSRTIWIPHGLPRVSGSPAFGIQRRASHIGFALYNLGSRRERGLGGEASLHPLLRSLEDESTDLPKSEQMFRSGTLFHAIILPTVKVGVVQIL